MNTKILANGLSIPQIGIGTWKITDRENMKDIINRAYDEGCRLIDTAAAYSNEIAIAKAVSEAGINRNELFLSDKVWNTNRGYEEVQEACRRSLKKLKTDYLDLYLIHWPASPKLHSNWKEINFETWRGMEKIYADGLVRAIGVCNFKQHHLEVLNKTASVKPMINQIELHPGMPQMDLADYCLKENILIEASSPLGNGQILQNDILKEISVRYNKSVAQICLIWELQKGMIVIPKSSSPDRISENLNVFDVKLTEEEMQRIDSIPYCGGIGLDSDEVIEFG